MADNWTSEKRSDVMGKIRGRGNRSTELKLIQIFRDHGIAGWRRNQKLVGKPDFTFRKDRLIIFVDGCFWHGCPQCYRRPKSNRKYWDAKVKGNKKRDREVNRELRKLGWRVARIWEHQLKNDRAISSRIKRLLTATPK